MLVIDQLKFSEFGASIFFQLSWQWQALPGLLLTRTTVIVFSSHNTQKKTKKTEITIQTFQYSLEGVAISCCV